MSPTTRQAVDPPLACVDMAVFSEAPTCGSTVCRSTGPWRNSCRGPLPGGTAMHRTLADEQQRLGFGNIHESVGPSSASFVAVRNHPSCCIRWSKCRGSTRRHTRHISPSRQRRSFPRHAINNGCDPLRYQPRSSVDRAPFGVSRDCMRFAWDFPPQYRLSTPCKHVYETFLQDEAVPEHGLHGGGHL